MVQSWEGSFNSQSLSSVACKMVPSLALSSEGFLRMKWSTYGTQLYLAPHRHCTVLAAALAVAVNNTTGPSRPLFYGQLVALAEEHPPG